VLPVSPDAIRGLLKDTIVDPANNIQLVAIESNFERQMMLLRRKKADYVISYFNPNDVAMMFSSRSKTARLKSSELFQIPLYLVLRRSTPDSAEVMSEINKSMVGK
jgi:hypothetical protein